MRVPDQEREAGNTSSSLLALLTYVRPHWVLALASFIALAITAALALLLPIFVREFVDGFTAAPLVEFDRSFLVAILIAGAFAAGTALRYALVTRLGEAMVVDIRQQVFEKVVGMSPAFYGRIMTGEVVSRLNTDTTLILSVVSSTVSVAMRNVLLLTGGLVLMAFTSPKLTLLVMGLVPIIIVPTIILGRLLRTQSRNNQDQMAIGSGNVSEVLLNIQPVQAFTREEHSVRKFGQISNAYLTSAYKRIFTRAMLTAIIIMLVFTGITTVIWVGARDARADVITSGQLVQFIIYAILVAGSVSSLSEVWGEILRAAGATDRIIELLSIRDSIVDPDKPVALPNRVKGGIRFDRVSFSYPLRPEVEVLSDVTFEVEPGETVAVVGPSGAGKSSIFQLLLRFHDPDTGVVSLDEIDISRTRRTDLRRMFALVPQDPAVFSDTVMYNIRFGREGASDEEVTEAARIADLHDFLEGLPDGYNTLVGERGMLLSGGQKQRLAIARAVLREAPVLLLDEATSSLDAESERAVQNAFRLISGNCTTLIIAHRLATVKSADRIIVLEKGKIVATGSHQQLVQQDGLYARLANLQFIDASV